MSDESDSRLGWRSVDRLPVPGKGGRPRTPQPIGFRRSTAEDIGWREPSESESEEEEEETSPTSASKGSPKREPKDAETSPKNDFFSVAVVVTIVCAIAASYVLFSGPNSVPSDATDDVLRRSEELYSLNEHFPGQSSHVWATIVSGVKNLYTSRPQQPCVILLLVSDGGSTGACLARMVAEKVAGDRSASPAVVDAGTVRGVEYGEVLEDLRARAAAQKALVINNLQDLSGDMAQSLHALCDRYNPAVQDALILLTLRGHQRRDQENVGSFAQRVLTSLWQGQVPADKLPALVSRIVSSVVEVVPEQRLPSRCG